MRQFSHVCAADNGQVNKAITRALQGSVSRISKAIVERREGTRSKIPEPRIYLFITAEKGKSSEG